MILVGTYIGVGLFLWEHILRHYFNIYRASHPVIVFVPWLLGDTSCLVFVVKLAFKNVHFLTSNATIMFNNFVLLSCHLVLIYFVFHLEFLVSPVVLNLAMADAVIVNVQVYNRICKTSTVDSLHFKLCWVLLRCFNQNSDVLHQV